MLSKDWNAFSAICRNGDGKLSAKEIYQIFRDHGVSVTLEEVQEIVSVADKDGSGDLNVQEFASNAKVLEVVDSAEKGAVSYTHLTLPTKA